MEDSVRRKPGTAGRFVLAVLAALASCGPPPAVSTPSGSGEASPGVDAGEPGAGPEGTAVAAEDVAVPVLDSPADGPFRTLLGALISGSARAVRAMVALDGRITLRSHLCRNPIYGVVACSDNEVKADRQRIDDALLSPPQDVMQRAVQYSPALSADTIAIRCSQVTGERWECATDLQVFQTGCRGQGTAMIGALLRQTAEDWQLLELRYEEEVILCE
jgi:hypothetical protein